jgi:NAD(P)H dehydrogenase (quinone)
MTIAVTAATGNLGRLVIDHLLARGVTPADVIAVVRDPAKAEDLTAKGVTVRQADYDNADALRTALTGAAKVLVISGTEFGRRVEQHANVIDAAIAVGAGLIGYTSILGAKEATANPLAPEHVGTEEYLDSTGAPAVIFRNGFYSENYLDQARQAAASGELLTSAGQEVTASASRDDFAAAIAAVLSTDGHEGQRYELAGDAAWTYDDFAQAVSEIAGKEIVVRQVDAEAHLSTLVSVGVPEQWAHVAVGIDQAVAAGELSSESTDLSRLAGRPTTPFADTLAAALAN